MNAIQYRSATLDDTSDISSLLSELGYQVSRDAVRTRLAEIQDSDGAVLVADNNRGDIVGCVHVFMELRLAEGKAAEIVSLVVNSGLRGSGVGSQLVDRAKTWARERGCSRLRVRANAIREGAHRFYQQHGFTPVKTQKVFIATLEDD